MAIENIREIIIEGTISIVAKEGLESFTTKKLAKEASIAEGSIYNYFKGKDHLLEESFLYVDHQIAALFNGSDKMEIVSVEQIVTSTKVLWNIYFDFLVTHPTYTMFYNRFRYSARYNLKVQKLQLSYFTDFINLFNKMSSQAKALSMINWDILWIYILDTTLCYGVRAVSGGFEVNAENKDAIFKLLSNGLFGLLQLN